MNTKIAMGPVPYPPNTGCTAMPHIKAPNIPSNPQNNPVPGAPGPTIAAMPPKLAEAFTEGFLKAAMASSLSPAGKLGVVNQVKQALDKSDSFVLGGAAVGGAIGAANGYTSSKPKSKHKLRDSAVSGLLGAGIVGGLSAAFNPHKRK